MPAVLAHGSLPYVHAWLRFSDPDAKGTIRHARMLGQRGIHG